MSITRLNFYEREVNVNSLVLVFCPLLRYIFPHSTYTILMRRSFSTKVEPLILTPNLDDIRQICNKFGRIYYQLVSSTYFYIC